MPRPSGKYVNNLRVKAGITSAISSTLATTTHGPQQPSSVQAWLLPKLFPIRPLLVSPGKVAASPLIEHYFYPVSTAPIINPIKGI